MSNDVTGPADALLPRRDWTWIKVPYAFIALLFILLLWQVGTVVLAVPTYIVPSPSAVISAITKNWSLLTLHFGITAFEVVSGFIISLLIAVPLAICITYSYVLDRALYPLIVASQTIPKVAIAPLLLVWFGFGMTPKIIIVVLVSFFPIVINSVVGLRSGPTQMIHLARSMGASGWQIFWHFRLPEALPSIFAGMKMSTVLCVIGAVVAEFVGAESGLGYLILVAGSNFDLDMQFAAIVILSAMGMIFFAIIGWIERLTLPWHVSQRSESDA